MSLNVILSRRDFLKISTMAAAIAVNPSMPNIAIAQQQLKDVIERRIPVNLDNLPEIVVKESRADYILDSREESNHLEHLKGKYPLMTKEPKLISAKGVLVVRPEPNMQYAQALTQIAKDSIDDFVRFLGVKFPATTIRLNFPQNENEISYKPEPNVVIYFVSDLKYRIEGRYRIIFGKEEQIEEPPFVINKEYAGHGVRFTLRQVGNEYQVIPQTSPIFYNTRTTPVRVLETPAIELLHRLVKPYTLRNIGRERSTLRTDYTVNDINKLVGKHEDLEEKFVHALSILWLRDYNKRRNIGFTEQELNQRFAEYEQVETYRGVNRLSGYIAQIGVKRAFEMYLSNPNELFRGSGIK